MATTSANKPLDLLLHDLESLKESLVVGRTVTSFLEGDYRTVLGCERARGIYASLKVSVDGKKGDLFGDLGVEEAEGGEREAKWEKEGVEVMIIGLAAFNAFLQANVTGPPLLGEWDISSAVSSSISSKEEQNKLREKCLKSLEVDGVSVYQHIPHIDLFSLARLIFTSYFPRLVAGEFTDCKWMRVRINAYHQRLLSGVSYGKLMDTSLLQNVIEKDLRELEEEIFTEVEIGGGGFKSEEKVMFLLEKAQIHILQGLDFKAEEDVLRAKGEGGFVYALSGALGKRTRFQQSDISQLVVFAKSKDDQDVESETKEGKDDQDVESETKEVEGKLKESGLGDGEEGVKGNVPKALDLNDDTLLESIEYAKIESDKVDSSALPPELKGMLPDQQPQLKPLDQITLLTEATLKDTLSPLDKLNSEEILPYAVRVLSDKPTNWQIYTQALLVRSRIESHRSRTQERSVLQLQVIVDQIIADTQEEPSSSPDGAPEIRITQFLPRAKASESAPVPERLKYIYQLNTPTRWEIETELAFAWSGAGSLISALEIFKRLKLWPEVALCYHSVGQEDKARQIVRRQLYFSSKGLEMDKYDVDASEVASETWTGPIRTPPPPHSPRLWCILGDLENDPSCWNRAWEISNKRYARAQRTLGEYYAKKGDLENAREAYMLATVVNRQNNDTWSRLGDVDLKVGNWDGAVIAFQQSIMIDDTDAKTYSNLGSALLSKHAELVSLQKVAGENDIKSEKGDEEEEISFQEEKKQDPKEILRQALNSYKRGAAIAHSNWQIWDNVITIAGRMSPPAFPELLMGLRAVIRIRAPSIGEDAIDAEILGLLVAEVVSGERVMSSASVSTLPGSGSGNGNGENGTAVSTRTIKGIYTPPRGSLALALITTISAEILPLITVRAELYALLEKLSFWRRDYPSALSYAEKAWRLVSKGEEWVSGDKERWGEVVSTTERLVGALENYGGMEVTWVIKGGDGGEGEREEEGMVEKGWKGRARSAVRGVMGRGRDCWEGSEGWVVLEGLLDGLRSS